MKLESRWLVGGMCAILALAFVPVVASAQMSNQNQGCSDLDMLNHKCTRKQNKPEQKDKYPNATRKQPSDLNVGSGERKALNEGLQAANNGDAATALKDLQPIVDKSSSAYAKALAMLGLAQVKYHDHDTKGAIALQKQAVDSNALDNNGYFQALDVLAQLYIANEDYSDALTTLDTWSKESGAQSADVEALKGNAYYRLQKYPQAVAAIQKAKSLTSEPKANWDQIEMASYFAMDKYDDAAKLAEAALAKDPNNGALLQNVIAIYVNANKPKKALALLQRAQANGQIKDEGGYLNMAKIYDNIAMTSDDPKAGALKAVAALKEGMDKGIVKPGLDSYKLLGQSYALAGDYKNAADAYAKAAPQDTTGETDFLRGVVLEDLGKHAQARDALKQALAKGNFKRVGAAYLTLGNAELELKNKSAAIAAYKQAVQDPETRNDAKRSLKQLGHK